MASLDVSDAFDGSFLDPLTIDRQLQVVDNFGGVSVTLQRVSPAPYGVIVPKDSVIGGNFVLREADMEYRGAALVVFTQFRLRSASKDSANPYLPDIVYFNGDPYLVGLINDFSIWGAGFIQAELSSMASVDNAPTGHV